MFNSLGQFIKSFNSTHFQILNTYLYTKPKELFTYCIQYLMCSHLFILSFPVLISLPCYQQPKWKRKLNGNWDYIMHIYCVYINIYECVYVVKKVWLHCNELHHLLLRCWKLCMHSHNRAHTETICQLANSEMFILQKGKRKCKLWWLI